jgi:hypothetical protein
MRTFHTMLLAITALLAAAAQVKGSPCCKLDI